MGFCLKLLHVCVCVPSALQVLSGVVGRLARCGVVYSSQPERLSKFGLLQAREGFRQCPPPTGVHVSASTPA